MHSNLIVDHAKEFCGCCFVAAMSEEGCEVPAPDAPSAILCADKRFRANHEREGRICDHVLFIERDEKQIVAPCELKGNNPNVDHACDQLQGGSEIAEEVLDDFPAPDFKAVLVSKKTLSPLVIKHLRSLKVTFRDQSYGIRPARCGDDIVPLLMA